MLTNFFGRIVMLLHQYHVNLMPFIFIFLFNSVAGNQSSVPANCNASDDADGGETVNILFFITSCFRFFSCMFEFLPVCYSVCLGIQMD